MILKTRQAVALGILAASAVAVGVSAQSRDAQARSAQYFAAHEADARKVVAACTAGTQRGQECENATKGLQIIAGRRAFAPSKFPTTDGKGY